MQGLVLRTHSADTPTMAPNLSGGATCLSWGGELEFATADYRSTYLSWSQVDECQFGIAASQQPFNSPLTTDQFTMTSYEPWWRLAGSRLVAVTAYGLPCFEGKFASVIQKVFETEIGRETLWLWTGTEEGVDPVDEIAVAWNEPPSNLATLDEFEALQ